MVNDFSYNGPIYLSTSAFQKWSGLSRDFIYKGIHNGTLPSIKCGKNFKINVLVYLNQL